MMNQVIICLVYFHPSSLTWWPAQFVGRPFFFKPFIINSI